MAAHGSRPQLEFLPAMTRFCVLLLCTFAFMGCGTIREQRATAQLLLSDAVDRSVANIDFTPLANEKVYLDTRFVQSKNSSEVTTNYVISSLRQQMVVAGCLLQDRMEDAHYVLEARVGTMGSDGYDINYGIPPSSAVTSAANLVSSSQLPVLPEISVAKRTQDMAAVKIAVFAYENKTKSPVWQSGTSLAKSEASGTWVLGAGPFKRGSIYDGTQFAGNSGIQLRANDKSELLPRDYTYRSAALWDPKLRQKVQDGEHMATLQEPDFEGVKEPIRVASSDLEQAEVNGAEPEDDQSK